MRQKVVRVLLRAVGPLLLVFVLWRLRDGAAIARVLRASDPWPLVIALVLTFVNLQLKVLRWDVLLRTRDIRYPFFKAWGAVLSSGYVGTLTPGRVGDALRAQYLRKDFGVGYAEGLASVVMDRLCDLYVLAAFVAVGVVRFSSVVSGTLAIVAWGGVAATVLLPILLFIPGVAESMLRVVYKKLASGDAAGDGGGGFVRFLEALRANLGRSLLLTIPLTVFAFGINYVQGWLMARSIHAPLSLYDVTCLMAIASLLGLLPISVSGVGVREVFFALAFPVLGYSAEMGVSFGLMVFAVIYLAMVVIGFVAWQISPPPAGPA